MWLAEHLHYAGSLRSLMRRIPYREFRMWMHRRESSWNQPSRADYYVMRLTSELVGMFGNSPSLDKMAIQFSASHKKVDPTIKSKGYIEQRKQEAIAKANAPLVRGPRPGDQS